MQNATILQQWGKVLIILGTFICITMKLHKERLYVSLEVLRYTSCPRYIAELFYKFTFWKENMCHVTFDYSPLNTCSLLLSSDNLHHLIWRDPGRLPRYKALESRHLVVNIITRDHWMHHLLFSAVCSIRTTIGCAFVTGIVGRCIVKLQSKIPIPFSAT